MKLISEYVETDIECIVEPKENGEKNFVIEGVFAQADKRIATGVSIQNQLWRRR